MQGHPIRQRCETLKVPEDEGKVRYIEFRSKGVLRAIPCRIEVHPFVPAQLFVAHDEAEFLCHFPREILERSGADRFCVREVLPLQELAIMRKRNDEMRGLFADRFVDGDVGAIRTHAKEHFLDFWVNRWGEFRPEWFIHQCVVVFHLPLSAQKAHIGSGIFRLRLFGLFGRSGCVFG